MHGFPDIEGGVMTLKIHFAAYRADGCRDDLVHCCEARLRQALDNAF